MIVLKFKTFSAVLLSIGLIISNPVFADDKASKSALPDKPQAQTETTKSVQKDVDAKAAEKASEKRKAIFSEAVEAVNETKNALKLLDEKKTKEALAALEKVTGKLELILAREPDLAFAPVDVNVMTHDLIANLDTIKAAIDEAEDYLEDGEIQKARPLVASLASEIVISTLNIPLATYPDAIKDVAPLIDEGKIDEAKAALQVALNTLVVENEVISLPLLRAKKLLKKAEALAAIEERTAKEDETLAKHLSSARYQLKMAEVLGYGDKKSFKSMYEQIDQIEEKTGTGESVKGWFDKLKEQLSDWV